MNVSATGGKFRSTALALAPIAGAALIAAALAWTAIRRDVDAVALALGAAGALAFLSLALRSEVANLKHHVDTALYSAFVLGTCICVYVLLARHDRRMDLTPMRLHTLSEATSKFLGLLRKDVEIVVFDSLDREYRPLLDLYSAATPRVRWGLHDPRRDPAFSAKFGATIEPETLYVRCGDKTKKLAKAELHEAALTNAILETTRERKPKIYFLEGHGELALAEAADSKEKAPLSELREALAERAMDPEPLNLVERGFIPDDAAAIALVAPARDLYAIEETQIEAYLAEGGRMLLYFDLPRQGEKGSFERLVAILRRRGIDGQDYVVIDQEGKRLFGSRLTSPVLWYNDQHPATEPLRRMAGPSIALPMSRSLATVKNPPPNQKIWPLIGSSKEAWSAPFEAAMSGAGEASGEMGIQGLGWAVEAGGDKEKGLPVTRLAAFGSSELANNRFLAVSGTAKALALNTIAWLTEQDDLIAVPPKIVAGTPLILDAGQLRMTLVLIAIAFPALIFFGGLAYAAWAKRG